MKVSNSEYNDLLKELASDMPEQLDPEEVTAVMLADATGYSINGARSYLDRRAKRGLLTKREVIYKGKITIAYSKKV